MHLAEALAPCLPNLETGGVIALVGAGGKTRAMFGLAEELAVTGRDVIMTTTTHIRDPRLEQGRIFDQVVLDQAQDGAADPEADKARPWDRTAPRPGRGRRIVFGAGEDPSQGKLNGVAPTRIGELDSAKALILVEADGAKCRPIKAPAPYEPVIPAVARLVLGVVGLDCLGQPMDETTVHRPERFGPIAGCAPGTPIRLEHIVALARSPQGLFKGTPSEALRVLLLNKADRCSLEPSALLDSLKVSCADLILVCTLLDPKPANRVLAQAGPRGSMAPAGHPPNQGETSRCP